MDLSGGRGTAKQSFHVLDVLDGVTKDLDLGQSLGRAAAGRLDAGTLLQRLERHVHLHSSSTRQSWLTDFDPAVPHRDEVYQTL